LGDPAWQLLTGLPAWEITQVPRRETPRPGLWDVWLLAGGDSPGAAEQIAGLLALPDTETGP
jgi:hypothetical protein